MFRITTLASTLMLLAAPMAHSQSAPLKCGPRADVVSTLGAKYEEQLIGGGLAGETRILEVWRAADGASWTILLTEAEVKSCIVASGENWIDFPEAMATMMDDIES